MLLRSFEETSKAVSRQFPESFMEVSGGFNCTGGAGVALKSGIELNSGLRAWVSVSLPSAGAPTRFADDGNSRPCTRSHITSAELCKKCINKCELPAYETGYWVPLPVTAAVATAVPTWASSRISTSGSTNCVKFTPRLAARCAIFAYAC